MLVVVARLCPHSIRSSGNVTYSYREVDSGLLASPGKSQVHTLASARLVGRPVLRPASKPWLANPGKTMPVGTWKVSLRLVHDPAGMGSWVRPGRAGERLVADVASSTYIVVFLKAAQVRLEVAALVLCTH